jgi:hypothetical protein
MADENDDTSTTPPSPEGSGESGSAQEGVAALGVLLVHGIGEQAQGETLTKFAEPIVDWIRDWLYRESAVGSFIASTPVDAALRPPLLPSGTPAHARVVIGARPERSTEAALAQEWLFAEAWWGPQVLTPPISSFTMWLVTRGPWLLMFHFNQRLLASRDLHNGWKWLIGIPLSILWVVVSLLLSVVLIAASLLAIIPIGRVRRAVFAVLRSIAGVVGDAYGQLRSPIQRAAFERAVLDAMQWLRPKCERLAVIAHSQGAAVAHGALRGGEPKADLLVTVGAGITKLEALRYLERLGPSDRIAGFLAPLLLVATAVVTLRTRALGLADAETRLVLPIALGIVGVAFLAQVWLTVRKALTYLHDRSERLSLTDVQPGLDWVDIVGTHDPVPAGELKRFFNLPAIDSRPIPILRSWIADHTSYWTARVSFMQVLVPKLAECAGLPAFVNAAAGKHLAEAERRLKVDLRALSAARWLDLVALALPFVFARDRLIAAVDRLRAVLAPAAVDTSATQAAPLRFIEEALANVEQALRWTADVIAGSPAAWARPAVNLAVAWLLISAVLLAWRRLEFAVWGAWSAGRNERALRGPVKLDGLPTERRVETNLYAAFSATFVNTAMAVTLLVAIGVSAAWSFVPSWVNEPNVYSLLGQTAAGLFVVLMILSQIPEPVAKLASLPERWTQWRSTHTAVTWPNLRAAISRIIEVAIGLLVLWLMIDQVMTLPAFLQPEIIYIGVFALLRGLVALLDGIWQRLDRAGASTLKRVTLLTLPIAIGGVAVTSLAFAPRTEPLEVATIVSGVALVGCLAAGLITLALRMRGAPN